MANITIFLEYTPRLSQWFAALRRTKIIVIVLHFQWGIYTMFQKVVHQANIDNGCLVNCKRIFKIVSLAHSAKNLL